MNMYSNRCGYWSWKRFMVLFGLVIAMLGTPAYAAITATVSGITVDKSSVALGNKVVFSAQVITNQSFSGSFQYNLRHRDTAQDFQVSSKLVKFVGGISSTQQVSFLLPTSLPEGAYDLTGRVYSSRTQG